MSIVVTGAAGFVGSHAVRMLARAGYEVVAYDLVPSTAAWRLSGPITRGEITYHRQDLMAPVTGWPDAVEAVWHFAANADIPLGATDTTIDLRKTATVTQRVLEVMREHSTPVILLPSSGSVYGARARSCVGEDAGPLMPMSLYAAGKLASEALVSAYAHMFGIRGMIFRLGNLVGGAMDRGIVRDFTLALRRDPSRLKVLGDGSQRKSYVLVDDAIHGMHELSRRADPLSRITLYNLAAGETLDVAQVAHAVSQGLGLEAPTIVPQGGHHSWSGDQPIVDLSIEKARREGWEPRWSAGQAVEIATRRLSGQAPPFARRSLR